MPMRTYPLLLPRLLVLRYVSLSLSFIKVLLLCFVAALLATNCKKDDPEAGLPPATQESKNTSGCFINGQVFSASGFGSGLGRVAGIAGGFAEDSLYRLRLNGTAGGKEYSLILFIANFPRTGKALVGTHLLNKDTPYWPQEIFSRCQNHATVTPNDYSGELYGTTSVYTGQVQITRADVAQRIASGTFEFTAVSNLDPTKTVRVTSGRFDRQQ